jgi:hypothetical protein
MRRQAHPDARNASTAMVQVNFSFLANGASTNPTIAITPTGTNYRGDGLLPLTAGVAAVAWQSAGKYLVTLEPGYTGRYVTVGGADIQDNPASPDGSWATISPITGEGGTGATSLTFFVYLWKNNAGTNTLTDFTGRRVSVSLDIKNSAAGS